MEKLLTHLIFGLNELNGKIGEKMGSARMGSTFFSQACKTLNAGINRLGLQWWT